MHPMKEFDPTKPPKAHAGLNDRTFEWNGLAPFWLSDHHFRSIPNIRHSRPRLGTSQKCQMRT